MNRGRARVRCTDYAGDTGWHSDGGHKAGDPIHIKIAFYLDHLTRDTGCLRVIPGSHILDDAYASRVSQLVSTKGVDGSLLPAAALETKPGDVVVFNHNCKHAAFGGGGNRRMFTMNLCQRYPEEKLGDLRKYLEGIARFLVDRPYGEIMIATAGPERSESQSVAAFVAAARHLHDPPILQRIPSMRLNVALACMCRAAPSAGDGERRPPSGFSACSPRTNWCPKPRLSCPPVCSCSWTES